MLEFSSKALCPLDGRYEEIKDELSEYFSEYALVKRRIIVEVKWLEYFINNILNIEQEDKKSYISKIKRIINKYNFSEFKRIKEIEEITKHDVKAIEYYINEKLELLGLSKLKCFVHIGCTSEDINNVAYALMIKEGLSDVWLKKSNKLTNKIDALSKEYSSIPMLAHTHGQPATPTTVGKELKVYAYRMKEAINYLKMIKIKAKFNGATGNYSALSIAYPNIDWEENSKTFIKKYLGLNFSEYTTQIEGHDYIARILDSIRNFNNILLDFNVDMWLYISMGYFKQIPVKNEVGSSTMPHKINPIKFENSEANIDISNSLCMALSNKLTKSRLQRDLSDSSSKRNIGLAIGYSLQAIHETSKGLDKCVVDKEKIEANLIDKWEVLAEPIQTMLRKYGYPDAYDKLKDLTRGKDIKEKDLKSFINSLDFLAKEDKKILLDLTPLNYIGYASKLADRK